MGYLGAHPENGSVVVRDVPPRCLPRSSVVAPDGKHAALEQVHPGGVFEGHVKGAKLPLAYQLEVDYGDSGTITIDDPYRFLPTIGELDVHLLGEGRHEELWERLGAHVREVDGVAGHRVRGLGASRAGGVRRRRLQLLGRPHPPDAHARLAPASGSCSCPASARGRTTSTRSSRRTARSA